MVLEVREESVGVSLAATDDDDNVVGSCLLPFCALPLLRENSPLCPLYRPAEDPHWANKFYKFPILSSVTIFVEY